MLHGHTITAPLHNPATLVDICCGTGVVTSSLAAKFPSASHVYGIDIVAVDIQSHTHDSKVEFIQGDFRSLIAADARLRPASADFAFGRCLAYGMRDWPGYIASVFALLKPGGWAECQEFVDRFYWEEADPPIDILQDEEWRWLRVYRDGGAAKGLDFDCGMKIAGWMKRAGFVDVHAKEYRIPYWRDVAKDQPELKEMAELVIDDPDGMFYHALPKMTESLGMNKEEMEILREQMMRCVNDERGKYQTYWTIIGKKPE